MWQPIYKVFSIISIILILVTSIQSSAAYAAASSSNTSTPKPTPTPVILTGDLNHDGRVDCLDLILLQMLLSGVTPPIEIQCPGAGIGCTANVTTTDRDTLVKIILGQRKPSGGGGGGGGGSTPTPAPQTNTVYFNSSSYATTYGPGSTGQNFTARVQIDNTNYLYNGTFTVNYNSSLLQVNNVSDGNFSGKDILMVSGSNWSNSAGALTVRPNLSAYVLNGSSSSGSGYLCDIQFQTITAGTSPLTINGTLNQLQTGNFSVIAGTTWTNSSVVITRWYNLNVSTAANGNVTAPGVGVFPYVNNSIVTLTAVPTSCWQFYRWEGDTSTIANASAASTTIKVNGSYAITANFSIKTFTLSVTANNSGGSPTGAGTYDCGTNATIHANTSSCGTFVSWTPVEGVANASAADTTVFMNKSRTLTANYNTNQYNLTINASIDGSTNLSTGNHTYTCGTFVYVQANPADCHILSYWSSSNVSINGSTDNPIRITMDGNKDLTPVFAVSATFALSLNASPTDGGLPYYDGAGPVRLRH